MKRPLPIHLYNQQISVYRNLSDHCLSVLYKQQVAGHAITVVLENVSFRVQEGVRQTVITRKRKKVHAFVDGTLTQCSDRECDQQSEGVPVTYNPYRAGYFYERETGKAVYEARLCVVTPAGILAYF